MNILYSFFWLFIPLLGTIIGTLLVFITTKNKNDFFKKIFYGFASGVMISASIWSLILPSIEISKNELFPVCSGFVIGIIALICIDWISKKCAKSKNIDILIVSMSLHNIPERYGCGCRISWISDKCFRNVNK